MLDANFLEESGMTDGVQGRVAMSYRIKDRELPTTFPRMFKSGE
jgi:8-oxo-dGTP diphosphatase